MAFVLVIFVVIVNRPEGQPQQQQQERRRSAATTRAPRLTPTTQHALPEPRSVNEGGGPEGLGGGNKVDGGSSLSGAAGDTTAIVASLVAVFLSGLAVAMLANPR